jgi:hypothetical protein
MSVQNSYCRRLETLESKGIIPNDRNRYSTLQGRSKGNGMQFDHDSDKMPRRWNARFGPRAQSHQEAVGKLSEKSVVSNSLEPGLNPKVVELSSPILISLQFAYPLNPRDSR